MLQSDDACVPNKIRHTASIWGVLSGHRSGRRVIDASRADVDVEVVVARLLRLAIWRKPLQHGVHLRCHLAVSIRAHGADLQGGNQTSAVIKSDPQTRTVPLELLI